MASPSSPMPTESRGVSTGGLTFMTVCIVMAVLSQMAVILRVIVRRKTEGTLAPDDWTLIVAQFLAYGLVAESVVFAEIGGIGWPIQTLPPQQLENFFKLFFTLEMTYSIICPLIKVSVLLLYRRIFAVPKFKLATLVMMVLCGCWCIASIGVFVFQCRPVAGFWDFSIREYCIDPQSFFWGNGISNLLLDVIILCMPIPMVWQLQMSRNRKLGIIGIFLLGGFVCVASILRVTSLGTIKDIDFTLTLAQPATWSVVEACVGIISACLPTYGPLFRQRKANTSAKSYGSSSKSYVKSHPTGSFIRPESSKEPLVELSSVPRLPSRP